MYGLARRRTESAALGSSTLFAGALFGPRARRVRAAPAAPNSGSWKCVAPASNIASHGSPARAIIDEDAAEWISTANSLY